MAENIRKQIEKELNSLKEKADSFSSAVEIVDEARSMAASVDKSIKETSDSLSELVQKQESQLSKLNEYLAKLSILQEKLSKTDIPDKLKELGNSLTEINARISEKIKSLNFNDEKIKELLTNLTSAFQASHKKYEENYEALTELLEKVQITASKLNKDLGSNHKEIKNLHLKSGSELSKIVKSENQTLKKEVNSNRVIIILMVALTIILQVFFFIIER